MHILLIFLKFSPRSKTFDKMSKYISFISSSDHVGYESTHIDKACHRIQWLESPEECVHPHIINTSRFCLCCSTLAHASRRISGSRCITPICPNAMAVAVSMPMLMMGCVRVRATTSAFLAHSNTHPTRPRASYLCSRVL